MPVLILAARDAIRDRLKGLDCGADPPATTIGLQVTIALPRVVDERV